MRQWHPSLRIQFLAPMVVIAIATAAVVAAISFYFGRQWATNEVENRFQSIQTTLDETTFPLTQSVVDFLALLTNTDLAIIEAQDRIEIATEQIESEVLHKLVAEMHTSRASSPFEIGSKSFLVFHSPLAATTSRPDVEGVLVLFDQQEIDAIGFRAAMLPLLTGLTTIIILLATMLFLVDRIIRRLLNLQQRVETVAKGNFAVRCGEQGTDQIAMLGKTVDSMALQLDQLWKEVNRQQASKLLHQIAGGMAHQLRNTLTGSRMAMELHARNVPPPRLEEVNVAIDQLKIAEDYVKRLLLVGQGKLENPQPDNLLRCLEEVCSGLTPVAKHLHKNLKWHFDQQLATATIADRTSLSAAISNLVLNAIDAAGEIEVKADFEEEDDGRYNKIGRLLIRVIDDGPGVESNIAKDLFEPFVTTKPDGMGIGLPTVRRSAESLNGQVRWYREHNKTVFEFECEFEKQAID